MPEPANREDVYRLMRLVENLDRKLNNDLNDLSEQLKRIQRDYSAALSAIGDERVEGESRYAKRIEDIVLGLKEEIKNSYDQFDRRLVNMDLDHEQLRRCLEDKNIH